ncbi:MAG: hypothetical protein HQL02_13490 [Nitrospirae bacterium]|nr:hypothetical protein [Nitrospirota bacterium]
MAKALTGIERKDCENIYNNIFNLRGVFLTTNADTHFDKFFESSNVFYKISEFSVRNIDVNRLYHIHGSIIARFDWVKYNIHSA